MATETEVELTNDEHLAEFDADMALQRLEVAPEDRTTWDLETAVNRAELEERLREIDDEYEAEIAAIDEDEAPAPPTPAEVLARRGALAERARRPARAGATFSAGAIPFDVARFCGADGDCVVHRGVIFRSGDYTGSHGFRMSRAELAAVVRGFRPVRITHGHPGAAGPLDDDMGEVRAVELSADGNDLIGTVVLPKWLREKLKAARVRVSASFDRITKRLCDVSLVTFPHIPDAELRAAFAASRGATVTKDFVLYRVGDTSWRGTGLTEGELARAAGRVRTPRPLDHPGSAVLRSVRLAEGGKALVGTVTMPAALDDEVHLRRRVFRCEFDRETKDLLSVALVEQGRPAEAIDSPSTFSRTERTTMSTASDLAAEARAQNDAYHASRGGPAAASGSRPPARFAAGVEGETDAEYASRVNDQYYGRRRPPEPAAASSPAGGDALPWVVQLPPPPTAEEDGAFLARLARAYGGQGAAAAAVRATAATLPVRAEGLARTLSFLWPNAVRPVGERLARLSAMARALELAGEGGPVAYTPPSPGEIAEAQGRLIASIALGKRIGPARLLAAVKAAAVNLHTSGAKVDREIDRHFLPSGLAAGDVEALRDKFHRTRLPLAGADAIGEAAVAFLVDYPPALGRAVARAIEDAGGREAVAGDLSAVHLIDATTPDPDEEELAAVGGQLKALGDSAGRAASGLKARHDELTTALEARRSEAREAAGAGAARELTSALAGDPDAVQALAGLVGGRPDAFHPGLAKALAEVPKVALAEVGHAGLAGVML